MTVLLCAVASSAGSNSVRRSEFGLSWEVQSSVLNDGFDPTLMRNAPIIKQLKPRFLQPRESKNFLLCMTPFMHTRTNQRHKDILFMALLPLAMSY